MIAYPRTTTRRVEVRRSVSSLDWRVEVKTHMLFSAYPRMAIMRVEARRPYIIQKRVGVQGKPDPLLLDLGSADDNSPTLTASIPSMTCLRIWCGFAVKFRRKYMICNNKASIVAMKWIVLLWGTRAMGWRRNGSFGGGSGEECVVTSLAPLGTAVALFERGSNNGVSKE